MHLWIWGAMCYDLVRKKFQYVALGCNHIHPPYTKGSSKVVPAQHSDLTSGGSRQPSGTWPEGNIQDYRVRMPVQPPREVLVRTAEDHQ
jgi:hypothetical protein